MAGLMRGVFAIPPTPFHDDGGLDEDGLRAVVRFLVDGGAHGVVTPVNASEFAYLTDSERHRVVEIAVAEVAGAVPVVAGVTGTCVEQAIPLARHARTAGADAVIAMPPYVHRAGSEQTFDYYAALAAAAALPVFVQNHLPPLGTVLDPAFVARLVREIDGVDYVKEECWPPGQYMSAEIELAGTALRGVMGGMAGRHLVEEYRRGACGTMPAGEIPEVHAQLWDKLEEGDFDGAEQLHAAMLPLLNFEAMHGVVAYKEVLRRRGIIASVRVREPGRRALDAADRQALDVGLDRLKPYFRLASPAGATPI